MADTRPIRPVLGALTAPDIAASDCETGALQRVYRRARHAIGDRIEIDEEIERRLAVVVLYTYSAEVAAGDLDENAAAALCVERLMAGTTVCPSNSL